MSYFFTRHWLYPLLWAGIFAQLGLSALAVEIPFLWKGGTFGELTSNRAFLLLPLEVEGFSQPVVFQLDLGSAETMLYENALPKPVAKDRLLPDSEVPEALRKEYAQIKSEGIRVAERVLHRGPLLVRREAPAPLPADPQAPQGTLGADSVGDIVILDFVKQNVSFDRNDLAKHSSIDWQPMEELQGSPLIRLLYQGKEMRFLFDTGSSAFSLLVGPETAAALGSGTTGKNLGVPSFGRTLTVNERQAPSTLSLNLGKTELQPAKIYVFEDKDVLAMLQSAKLDGLIGMSPFQKDTVILDFKEKRFGVSSR